MARIRIIDEWLRSPVSAPHRHRAVLVVADSWSEQRVLMRGFAASQDQTRPTITLRGADLAIGPAGLDPHGPWGIHVDPPVEGRAQELRSQLEEAARRLAGARRSPPRLEDEESPFERRATNVWLPGEALPGAGADAARGSAANSPAAGGGPSAPPAARRRRSAKKTDELFPAPLGRAREPRVGARRGAAAESPATRGGSPGGVSSRRGGDREAPERDPLAAVVGRTMPFGFQLTSTEREVLNALGHRGELAPTDVAALAGADDGAVWMRALIAKLAEHGLDIVAARVGRDGALVYHLRR